MMPAAKILIVDDDPDNRKILEVNLEAKGYATAIAQDGEEALLKIKRMDPDLILLDIRMPKIDGMEVLRRVKDEIPETVVVMITSYGTIEIAVEAMKLGAYDFITKPLNPAHVLMVVEKALERKSLIEESAYLRDEVRRNIEKQKGEYKFEEIIGNCPPIRDVHKQVAKVAPTDAIVLIQGESGTGQGLIAKAIHNLSPRKEWPFVVVNCGAIPETLMESELFGHEKGAFTGAYTLQKGKFELSEGGTIFLDEIGEIPLPLQVKLFRVLESGVIERIGGKKPIKTDARIIAATSKNLENEVKEGTFRMELYYRLNVVSLTIPPLRERGGDIDLLGDHFFKKFIEKYKKDLDGFTEAAREAIGKYSWPGNVRELEHKIERAVIMTEDRTISSEDLQISERGLKPSLLREAREGVESRRLIEESMAKNRGNISQSAKELGVTRKTLRKWMERYDIKRDEFLNRKDE